MNFKNKIYFNSIKDHSVTKENFQLHYDEDFELLITHPKPDLKNLGRYYESEDYISHTDNKRSLLEKLYQFVKGIALKNKVKLINSLANKGNLLDIGAGTGDFLTVAKNNGWNTIGIEPNDKAKQIALSKGVKFSNDLESLPDDYFDIITMWHVLEHVPDLENQINQLKRLLKKEGSIVIAVPNFKSYDAKYYKENWAAYDVPRHLWHFSKTSIDKIFSTFNLKLIKVLPMKFDSFYVSLLSEKYKTGKMNFLKAFWIGWKSNRYGNTKNEFSSHIYILKHK
jgi:2-polyprenyl-3-methyl-5-hydroxy-6-metoxy-1,4-benzoquinol methylase